MGLSRVVNGVGGIWQREGQGVDEISQWGGVGLFIYCEIARNCTRGVSVSCVRGETWGDQRRVKQPETAWGTCSGEAISRRKIRLSMNMTLPLRFRAMMHEL